jgi:lipid A disaccharide synthetase
MAGLKELTGSSVDCAGVGGETVREEGLASLFPQADLAAMGFAERCRAFPASSGVWPWQISRRAVQPWW